MTAAPSAPYERPHSSAGATTPPRRPRTERDDRIEASIATGARVPSEDLMTNGGWFAKIPHALITILCQAHGLSGTHYRYLLTLIQHSQGFQSDFAIRTIRDRRPPTIADWSAWLGDISKKQVYAIRRELRQWHLIYFIDEDSDKVALNLRWETWDQALFERQICRRPPRQTITATNKHEESAVIDPVFLGDAPVTCNLLSEKNGEFADDQSVTCNLPADGDEPSPEAASDRALNKVTKDTKEGTDASASDAPSTSSAPTLSPNLELSEKHEPRPRAKRRSSQKKAALEPTGSLPPNSVPPPLSHGVVPPRLDGETTRVYWLRLYREVTSAGEAQRLAHRCAHAELGFAVTEDGTLAAEDCILLAQLKHDAGSWGTVMHWLLTTALRDLGDPREYLRGIARRNTDKRSDQRQTKGGKPRKGQRAWEFPTSGENVPHEDDEAVTDGEQEQKRPPLDEFTRLRNGVSMVYAWNYAVGKELHLTEEQENALLDAAAAILVEQQETVYTCRRRAERAATMAKTLHPQARGQARTEHILAALREHW